MGRARARCGWEPMAASARVQRGQEGSVGKRPFLHRRWEVQSDRKRRWSCESSKRSAAGERLRHLAATIEAD